MHKLLDDSNCVKFRNEIYQPIIPKNALFDMEMDDDNDDATTTDKVQAYMYLAATTDGTLKMRTEFLTNPRNRIDVQEWHSG